MHGDMPTLSELEPCIELGIYLFTIRSKRWYSRVDQLLDTFVRLGLSL
jgi:hypothetical protein